MRWEIKQRRYTREWNNRDKQIENREKKKKKTAIQINLQSTKNPEKERRNKGEEIISKVITIANFPYYREKEKIWKVFGAKKMRTIQRNQKVEGIAVMLSKFSQSVISTCISSSS